jgi:hypothetical protein
MWRIDQEGQTHESNLADVQVLPNLSAVNRWLKRQLDDQV